MHAYVVLISNNSMQASRPQTLPTNHARPVFGQHTVRIVFRPYNFGGKLSYWFEIDIRITGADNINTMDA